MSAGAAVPWFVVEAVTRARITTDMEELVSEGLRLGAHFARPAGVTRVPGLLVLPGFPRGAGGAAALGNTDQTLCDRIARESGWAGLTFTFRGPVPSEGDFSIEGWLADVAGGRRAARAHRHHRGVDRGVPARRHARDRHGRRRRTRARYRDLRRARVAAHVGARAGMVPRVRARTGVLRTPDYPPDPEAWIRAIANLDPIERRSGSARRPWLLVHGSADDVVPVDDARRLADAGGDCVDLRIVANGPHRLRHDPRAIAALLGWLDRQEP